MAKIYSYLCSDCGLEGSVSGGKAALMSGRTQTFYCTDCCNLFDETINENELFPSKPECYICSSTSLVTWFHGQPCPKCKGKLKIDPLGLISYAD